MSREVFTCGGPQGGQGQEPGCGEEIATDDFGMFQEEVGEFWDAERQESFVMHAQCGIDRYGLDGLA